MYYITIIIIKKIIQIVVFTATDTTLKVQTATANQTRVIQPE